MRDERKSKAKGRVGIRTAATASIIAAAGGCAPTPLMTTDDYNELTGPPPDAVVAYGDNALQFGHLRLPSSGSAPYPVVMVIHGGCWLAEYDLTGTEALSAALTEQGVATWNIEYRRVGDAGGGWPGTFEDVAAAADHLRSLARDYPLDLDRTIATGHSAGGHLALWLGARSRLPAGAPGAADPFRVKGVVSLAGATDLIAGEKGDLCGDAIRQLMGGDSAALPDRYALASPQQLLPLGIPQVLVNGLEDTIVPPFYSVEYAEAARRAGDDAAFLGIRGAGHFEVVAPEKAAWRDVEDAILDMLSALGSPATP